MSPNAEGLFYELFEISGMFLFPEVGGGVGARRSAFRVLGVIASGFWVLRASELRVKQLTCMNIMSTSLSCITWKHGGLHRFATRIADAVGVFTSPSPCFHPCPAPLNAMTFPC